jgi:PAS domain S-box-containing protein
MQTEPDYRELVEHAGDMIYTLDLSGAFTYMNTAGLAMLGYTADELLGLHFREMLTPGSAQIALEHFQRGIEGTESTPFFEVQAVRKDGTLVDVEIRAGNLYRDGEIIGRQGVARDIGTLKQLQAEVAEKSQRLTLLADQARSAMDLYRRIAELTLAAPSDPEATGRALRDVEGTLARVAAQKLGLDAQDVEIIQLLGAGRSNREIGEHVHLSPNTVKDRVSKLMRILGGRSRAEVVAQAARRGLIVAPHADSP